MLASAGGCKEGRRTESVGRDIEDAPDGQCNGVTGGVAFAAPVGVGRLVTC